LTAPKDNAALYRTPPRPRGPRAAGTDSRPGEDIARAGQKSYVGDPAGTPPTERAPDRAPKRRRQEGAPAGQPVRGNEPPDAEDVKQDDSD
jgi:hypothetical protein